MNDNKPVLCLETEDGKQIQIAFGYLNNEPVAAFFKDNDEPFIIPKEVLEIALEQGWNNKCIFCTEGEGYE